MARVLNEAGDGQRVLPALAAAPLLLTAGLLTRSALKGVGKSHGTPMEKIIRDWRETGQIDISKLPRNDGSWLNQSKN